MQQRIFGTTQRLVAAIGQGSWKIDEGSRAQAIEALAAGLELGMTHIDTAEMYGGGASERIVGEAIRGRREQVFLVSKVLPGNASKAGVLEACEWSLRNLGTDHMDCYLLHWPGREPLAGTIAGFERELLPWCESHGVALDAQDLAGLEAAFPRGARPRVLPTA